MRKKLFILNQNKSHKDALTRRPYPVKRKCHCFCDLIQLNQINSFKKERLLNSLQNLLQFNSTSSKAAFSTPSKWWIVARSHGGSAESMRTSSKKKLQLGPLAKKQQTFLTRRLYPIHAQCHCTQRLHPSRSTWQLSNDWMLFYFRCSKKHLRSESPKSRAPTGNLTLRCSMPPPPSAPHRHVAWHPRIARIYSLCQNSNRNHCP